ncbi:hypothetical protein JCM8115_006135 [Rhodotorula mucilaginosa]
MPIDAAEWLVQNATSYKVPPASDGSASDGDEARLVVVINAHSGACKAQQLWEDVMSPLLHYALPGHFSFDGDVRYTKSEGDGERIGRELRQQQQATTEGSGSSRRLVVLVLGGDGTVHEVLNGLLVDEHGRENHPGGTIELVLVPAGTANALYYHTFPPESPPFPPDLPASPYYSLLSFLQTTSANERHKRLQPVALAINALPVTASPEPLASVLTSVVSSAALHACLLHDAEQLRATHPGLERFKMAAQKNVQRWWNGTLKLKGNVRVYSPAEQGWVSTSGASETTTVEGPFAYLVTALVSRFEHSFIVAPFRNAMHPLAPHAGENPSVDVVCVRPQRHGRTRRLVQTGREQEAREDWIQRVWDVMGGMYAGGKHVDLTYTADEFADEDDCALTDAVVEVFRCERLEWLPVADTLFGDGKQACTEEDDLKARLVCLDGALHDLGTLPAGQPAAPDASPSLRLQAIRSGEGVSIWR